MKKTKYIVLAILIAAFVLTSVACNWKNAPATVATFYEVTNEHGCTVVDEEIKDEAVRSSVKESAFAVKYNGSLSCGFLIANDNASAKTIFAGTHDNIKKHVSGSTSSVSKTLSNYSYARVADNDLVYYLARIDNTILYVYAAKDYDGEAENIMKALGYK